MASERMGRVHVHTHTTTNGVCGWMTQSFKTGKTKYLLFCVYTEKFIRGLLVKYMYVWSIGQSLLTLLTLADNISENSRSKTWWKTKLRTISQWSACSTESDQRRERERENKCALTQMVKRDSEKAQERWITRRKERRKNFEVETFLGFPFSLSTTFPFHSSVEDIELEALGNVSDERQLGVSGETLIGTELCHQISYLPRLKSKRQKAKVKNVLLGW